VTFVCKYTDLEIAAILAAYRSGASREELCRRHGISVRTLFRWQLKAGLNRPALSELVGSLQEENARLRRMLADAQGEQITRP